MPQDTKGLVLLYGQGPVSCSGSVIGRDQRRQNSKDSLERSLESSIDQMWMNGTGPILTGSDENPDCRNLLV